MEFTNDKLLLKNPQYHKIRDMLTSLLRNQETSAFAGNCVATCDIVQALLSQIGISSKIIECQVCVIKNIDGNRNYMFVGYDNYSYPGQIDTHTIVVTEDNNPILIDMTLGHHLPQDHQYIIERISDSKKNTDGKEIIAEYTFKNAEITYFAKKNLRLANIHQKNLVQRLVDEQKFKATMAFMQKMMYVTLGIALVNFLLNLIMIVLRLYDITWVDK